MSWKTIAYGSTLLMALVGARATTSGLAVTTRAVATVAAESGTAPSQVETPPVLTDVPRHVAIESGSPNIVTITGRHFDAGSSLTLTGLFYVATFDHRSMTTSTTTTMGFDAASLPDGTYSVSVRTPSGAVSNTLTLTIQRR